MRSYSDLMRSLADFDFKQNARFVIPLFMYGLSLIGAIVARFDFRHFFSREVPRVGSELCKIACALMLGTIALGLKSEPLRDSPLGKRPDSDFLAASMLFIFTLLFFLSYKCFSVVEGRVIWREEKSFGNWAAFLVSYVVGQVCGLWALFEALVILRGGQ
jgi:hypothetical protein